MMFRATRSRAWRKFFRGRWAVVALCVISLYGLFGLYVLLGDTAASIGEATGWFNLRTSRVLGAFTLDKAEEVVGPDWVRGFLEPERNEKRVEHCKYYLDQFRKAERQQDKAAAFAALRFGENTVVDEPVEQIRARLKDARALYDDINQSANLDTDPAVVPKIEQLEKSVNAMFRPLHGFAAFMQDFRMSMGTDNQGRSLLVRGLYSIKVSIQIGLIVSIIAVLLGSVVGAAAGYYGGWVDQFVVWLYTTLSSIPDLLLLAVLVFAFTGTVFADATKPWLSLIPVYVAMTMTFWIGPCRIVRGEALKLRELEYVQAATAIGFGRFYILLRHILPNTIHLMFINFSLLFIAAVKFEVILSFLGLGVKVGPSWGRMISDARQDVLSGNFWQIGVATFLMFFLVLAFNILSDALQDAFDPKHVG